MRCASFFVLLTIGINVGSPGYRRIQADAQRRRRAALLCAKGGCNRIGEFKHLAPEIVFEKNRADWRGLRRETLTHRGHFQSGHRGFKGK